MNAFDLKDHELTVTEVYRNLPVGALYEHAIRYEKDASIAENGALVAYSGAKTGRSHEISCVDRSIGTREEPLHRPVVEILLSQAVVDIATVEQIHSPQAGDEWHTGLRGGKQATKAIRPPEMTVDKIDVLFADHGRCGVLDP